MNGSEKVQVDKIVAVRMAFADAVLMTMASQDGETAEIKRVFLRAGITLLASNNEEEAINFIKSENPEVSDYIDSAVDAAHVAIRKFER